MKSIWRKTCEIKKRPALEKNLESDIVVIGAGMAGLMIAYLLQKAGKQVAVLEAGRIAGGQTQNTTAKITSQHGLFYDRLLKEKGKEKATAYVALHQQAIRTYRDMIEKERIDCDFEETWACVFSQDKELLKKEEQAALLLGEKAEFLPSVPLPFAAGAAVRVYGQAQFHPLKFISAISENLRIYENTPVQSVEGNQVCTAQGTVRGEKIIFACHYPFVNFPGLYFSRIHQERSYILALENAQQLEGMYIGVGDKPYSFRNYGNFLLLGGEKHRCGENMEGGRYEKLRQVAKEWFPGSREVCCWSAQDGITADALPFIGKYAFGRPDWYVASGFQKWGMTTSMASALLLTREICGKGNSDFGIVSPRRFSMREVGKAVDMGTRAVKSISKRIMWMPQEETRDIASGHGGIVRTDQGKEGVYRDEKGKVHAVSVRCPHMGCELEWNPDEASWDCPCHGSRFDYDGNLLSGPAKKGSYRVVEDAKIPN